VISVLQEKVVTQEPHKVYKEAISKAAKNTPTVPKLSSPPEPVPSTSQSHGSYLEEVAEEYLENSVNPVTDIPRNVKQVQNVRYKVKNDKRLTRDSIFNAHEIAYDDLSFTWNIQTVPDLVIIVGMKYMLMELQTVVQRGKPSEQLLGYDTTFTLGDYFVSVLVFKHTLLEEQPVMAALYLIHERKFASHHKMLFEVRDREVKYLYKT
jgi:hypothetical protein